MAQACPPGSALVLLHSWARAAPPPFTESCPPQAPPCNWGPPGGALPSCEPEAPGGPILQGPGKVARPSVGSQRVGHNLATQQQPARPQGCCVLHAGRDGTLWAPDTPSGGSHLCCPQDWGRAGTGARTPHRTISDMPWESLLHSLDVSSGFGLGGCLSPCRLGDLLVADKYQPPYQVGPHCDLSERAFLLLSRSVG